MTVSTLALVISLASLTLSVWDWRRTRRRHRCKDCLGEFDVDPNRALQDIANDIRADWGLPPLDPPNPITGYQRR